MANKYYQDKSSPEFYGDDKTRQPSKGAPERRGVRPKSGATFSKEYVSPGNVYSNERKGT